MQLKRHSGVTGLRTGGLTGPHVIPPPLTIGFSDMSATKYPSMAAGWRLPNLWDAVAFVCVIGALVAFGHVARGHAEADRRARRDRDQPRSAGTCRTTRCAPRCGCSPRWPRRCSSPSPTAPPRRKAAAPALVLVPVLDVLQSVPILGFLTFTVVFFMSLFPGQVLGLELAAIFAIFTSQAWNMAFSMYQSLKTVPADLDGGARQLPPDRLAAILAAGGAVRHARAGVEHHDVDVRRLVLRRRVGGRVGRRQHLEAARHRLLCRAGAGAAGHRRRGLGDPGDAGGDPRLRPVAVPPAGRLVGQVPLRDHRRRHRLRPLDAAADAPHPAAEILRRGVRRRRGLYRRPAAVLHRPPARRRASEPSRTVDALWIAVLLAVLAWAIWRVAGVRLAARCPGRMSSKRCCWG